MNRLPVSVVAWLCLGVGALLGGGTMYVVQRQELREVEQSRDRLQWQHETAKQEVDKLLAWIKEERQHREEVREWTKEALQKYGRIDPYAEVLSK